MAEFPVESLDELMGRRIESFLFRSTAYTAGVIQLIRACLIVLCALFGAGIPLVHGAFRAGVAEVDVTPPTLPVIQNGGFIESSLAKVDDPLFSKAFVFQDDQDVLAVVVVDSCMIPRTVCDQAKDLAGATTGIARDRILIAATHTHSAPSVMDYCLGSRKDPRYAAFLPGKIAESIRLAHAALRPAEIGTAVIDAGEFTSNRRWITRPDKMLVDPFGKQTVRAMMHPGHGNPDYVGPSGPIDPWLSVVSIRSLAGKPLGILANFSMHYFSGHAGVSADYYGEYARQMRAALDVGNDCVVAMSQGTSGDLWWGDYSLPERQTWSLEEFTSGIVEKSMEAMKGVDYRSEPTLAMAEQRITLGRRLPSAEQLAWGRAKVAALAGKRPRNRPEVYAEQAQFINNNPTEEVVLQAIRIGDFCFTGMPNEVYALTGLKLKASSPLKTTINMSLANGAAGYIPPPEQHLLGGYTTWPARTAGLEVGAEPKIVEQVGELLAKVSGRQLKSYREPMGEYAAAIRESNPFYRWRMGEQARVIAGPSVEANAKFEGQVAFHLKGVAGRGFGGAYESRSVQFVGGHLAVENLAYERDYSLEFWFWNALPESVRPTTALLFRWGSDELEITGSADNEAGRLKFGDLIGDTPIRAKEWYHVVITRKDQHVKVYLNGIPRPEIVSEKPLPAGVATLTLGGAKDSIVGLEGRLDEVALYDRSLSSREVQDHFRAAGLEESAALTPGESMAVTHVRSGYRLELVAAEPLVMDPVAIDWGSDGRLWVAEMADYPYGLDGAGQPGGRIRFLVDEDLDGQYDHSQVFMEDINFPTSVMPWRNGVLVTAAPEIFFAEDRDGDGRADAKTVLFRGFMEGNQQLRVNCLRWGLDGWIYCASGGHHAGFGRANGIEAILTGTSIPLGSRDFRFQPDSGELVPLSGPSQFGRVRDDWGNWFGVQNSNPLWHYVLPDPYLQRNTGVSYPDPRVQVRQPSNPRVYMNKPVQKRFHSFEQSSRFTSACGPSIYRDQRLFPLEPGLTHAFTCEPFHNVVQHHVLTESGVSFEGRRAHEDGAKDFFASADRWSRPVMTRTGPEGALYVVDMYRYMIEHPDWLPAEGREELKPFYRSGEDQGRIYRIVPETKEAPAIHPLRLGREPSQWLASLQSPNGRLRDLAHQRILEERPEGIAEGVAGLLASGHSRTRLQALAILHGMGELRESWLLAALKDPSSKVRRTALRFVGDADEPSSDVKQQLFNMTSDADAKVRLQLALTLGELSDPEAGNALVRLAQLGGDDPMTVSAIMSSATPYFEILLASLLQHATYAKPLAAMAAIDRSRSKSFVRTVLRSEKTPVVALATWLDQIRSGRVMALDLLKEKNQIESALRERLEARLRLIGEKVSNGDLKERERVALFRLLGRVPLRAEKDAAFLLAQLNPQAERSVREAALHNLTRFGDMAVGRSLLSRWKNLLPNDRDQWVTAFTTRQDWLRLLVDAWEAGRISPSEISLLSRERVIRAGRGSFADRLRQLFAESTRGDRAKVLEEFQPALARTGDVDRGRKQFVSRCSACHKLEGIGQAIGPDLRSLSIRSPEFLLSAILQPSAAIEPKYVGYQLTLENDDVVYGMIERESGGDLVVRQLDGQSRFVSRESITRIESSRSSFMPDGLEEGLDLGGMADLLAFLGSALER